MNVQLIVNKGAARGRKVQLHHETTIVGRRRDCNLCIPSSEVSRRHCLLQFQDGCLTVEDLNSVNGTFLNEARIAGKSVVYPGDRLFIGPVHFTVQYELSESARERLRASSGEEPLDAVPVMEEEPSTVKIDPDAPIPMDTDFEVVENVGDSQVVEIVDDPEIVEIIEDAEIVEEVEDAQVVEIIEDAEVAKEVSSPKKRQRA